MTGITRQVVLSAALDAKVHEFARELGIGRSAAIRMLVGRSLGLGLPRLLVDEKTLEVKNIMARRFKSVIDQVLRQELHALVDEVAPPPPEETEPSEEEAEVAASEPEPEVKGMRGRRPAKARRRR